MEAGHRARSSHPIGRRVLCGSCYRGRCFHREVSSPRFLTEPTSIDGAFAGNTPSYLAVPEGERSVVVKKSGYKNWERKMKVVAGSGIQLNAEMEKSSNP